MNIFNNKDTNEESGQKSDKGKNKRRILILLIIILVMIAVALLITFYKKQNQISNNYDIKTNETQNIVARKAVITEFSGDVIINRDQIDIKAFNDFRLQEGDIIKAGSDSVAKIDIDGNKFLKMDNNSIIQISAMSGDETDNITTIKLSNGRLLTDIKEKISANSRYEVRTLNTVIGVKGTVFVVTCESNQENNYFTKVESLEGSVEVAKINIQNSNEILDKVILNTDKYTVVEEKTNKQEKLKLNEIDKEKLDEFIKKDLEKKLIEKNNQNTQTATPTKPSEITSTLTKPSETTSTPTKANETTSTPTKPSETTSTPTKPSETTSTPTKPSETTNTDKSNNVSPAPVNNTPVIKDLEKPTLIINGPTVTTVRIGDQLKFVAQYFDNVGIKEIMLTPGHIVLKGFKANISVTGTGNSKIILLSNIQGDVGTNKYIEILQGTSIDTSGNVSSNAISAKFGLEKRNVVQTSANTTN